MRNLFRWLGPLLFALLTFFGAGLAHAETIPIVSLDGQGQETVSNVSRQDYIDGLSSMMRAVESESHAALEQSACAEKDWQLGFVALSIGLSANVGFPPFFEIGIAPRFGLAFTRGSPFVPPIPCNPTAIATDTLGSYLQTRIADLSSVLVTSPSAPVLLDNSQEDAWYFSSFILGIAPEVTFTVKVASLTVIPSLGLGWMHSLPDGWEPYRPSTTSDGS